MRRNLRVVLCVLIVLALAVGVAAPVDARPSVKRRGTIASGVFTTSPAWSCQIQADCAPWLATGCPAEMAGSEAAWLTAIVDVRSLADGKTQREFRFGRGQPAGLIFGGVFLQYWTAGCKEITSYTWSSFIARSQERKFVLPKSAAFMTIAANDNLNIEWELR